MKIEEIKFYLDITIDRFLVYPTNLGAVTLKRGGREFVLDVTQSYTYDDDDCNCGTTIQCDVEIDRDTFDDCKFDLTTEDLLSKDIFAEFFITSDEEEFNVERMFLCFSIDGEQKRIKMVNELSHESRVSELITLRKDWTMQDFKDAYADEWGEMPETIKECKEKMSEYIYHTYDESLVKDCIENETL